MSQAPQYTNPEFDDFAENYDEALEKGIAVSGERKEYFAEARALWLGDCLRDIPFQPQRILDFGCGTGTSTTFLLKHLDATSLLGVEVSAKSISVARRLHGAAHVQFELSNEFEPRGDIDLAFCNGVFHHIPLAERAGAVRYVFDALRSGGLFAFWENNPWNPGTRYVMSRIPFDRDAITIPAPEARRLLIASGFEIVRTDFLFIFPRALSWFRSLESALAKFPLGAQYMVLARKP